VEKSPEKTTSRLTAVPERTCCHSGFGKGGVIPQIGETRSVPLPSGSPAPNVVNSTSPPMHGSSGSKSHLRSLGESREHPFAWVQKLHRRPKAALVSAVCGITPPFPKPEWQHVLSGTAVNLDVVFSGLFPPSLMTKSPPPSETSTSQLAGASHPKSSNLTEIGPSHGMPQPLPFLRLPPSGPRIAAIL